MLKLSRKQYKKVLVQLLSFYDIDMKVWIDFENERLYTLINDRVNYMDARLTKVIKDDWLELPLSELKTANKVILEDLEYIVIEVKEPSEPYPETKGEAVVAVIQTGSGGFVAVTRKNNPKAIGLPGGKVDTGETLVEALRREVLEETGITLEETSIKHVFTQDEEGFVTYAFVAKQDMRYLLKPVADTEGFVRIVSKEDLCSDQSPFKEYNQKLFEILSKND